MFEKNSKFPRFFIYMLIPIAIVMLVGMFFSAKIVANAYFIALLISVVFMMLDRHHGENLTNYKMSFFLFDLITLIAVSAILYYEFAFHSTLLNIFLVILLAIIVLVLLSDLIIVKNKNISKKESVYVSLVKIGSMICILTYFYNVSDLFFVFDALIFEIANLVIKFMISDVKREKKENKTDEYDLVSVIRSEEEGDFE